MNSHGQEVVKEIALTNLRVDPRGPEILLGVTDNDAPPGISTTAQSGCTAYL